MKCYHYSNFGHPTYRCLEKATSSHVEKRINNLQEDSSSVNSPEVNLDIENGENLKVRRMLIREPVKEDPKQRRSLFKVKCKILGKVCKVIINSGSIDNIISEEALSKLGLSSMPHSHPYKVTWLNKGQHVLVNEQVWVEFSIGKYSDIILCDVLPMVVLVFWYGFFIDVNTY